MNIWNVITWCTVQVQKDTKMDCKVSASVISMPSEVLMSHVIPSHWRTLAGFTQDKAHMICACESPTCRLDVCSNSSIPLSSSPLFSFPHLLPPLLLSFCLISSPLTLSHSLVSCVLCIFHFHILLSSFSCLPLLHTFTFCLILFPLLPLCCSLHSLQYPLSLFSPSFLPFPSHTSSDPPCTLSPFFPLSSVPSSCTLILFSYNSSPCNVSKPRKCAFHVHVYNTYLWICVCAEETDREYIFTVDAHCGLSVV